MGCKMGGEEEWDRGETKLLKGDKPLAGCGVLDGGNRGKLLRCIMVQMRGGEQKADEESFS